MEVRTPDGYGEVLGTQSVHGRTSYLVKGAGFEGWYDGLEVTADFADHPDDVIPNEANETTLPYPSQPQGPGWDGTTSTIQPDIDPHLDIGGASDSLTGEPTDEDPVQADIEGLFEPPSRLAGVRPRRVHFAASDDPILDVAALPEESPTGLENSPINPDGVDTDDLFSGESFESRTSSYDRLVIEDDLSFMRYAADDDEDKKKHHREQGPGQVGYPKDSDSDDDSSDSDSDGDSDGGDSGGDGGGGHTAAVALTTTADLHFLANLCSCAASLPLHSKSEHRELVAEAGADEVTAQPRDLSKLLERYEQEQFTYQESNLDDLVDHSRDSEDNADLYNHYASVGRQAEVEHKVSYEGGMPGVRSGKTTPAVATCSCGARAHGATRAKAKAALSHKTAAVEKVADGYDKYIGGSDGSYYLIASGGGKLPKGQHYGHYETYEDAHNAVEAIIARNHSKTAAPAADPNAQPTQIESQIEQLMQFWAVDNNGWWHWTGSQADLALLNQMQQQMMAVGMPGGPPGQMQTQSKTAAPALLAALPEIAGAGAAAEGAAAGEAGGVLKSMMPSGGGSSPGGMVSGLAQGIQGLFGSDGDAGVARHDVPFQTYGFAIESNTPPAWREYLQTVASDRLVALAAWSDVVQKSKRLRAEGAINLEVFRPEVITAYVQGDNGRYYTTVQRLGSVAPGVGRQLTSTQVSGWSCECDWGHWAWLRKRSFVGRMCSHAYALFSEMRSLDARSRRNKGKPAGGGTTLASTSKTSWSRSEQGFEWVTADPGAPTAAIIRTASGWNARVWSDGTAEDSLSVGTFSHSEQARRAASRVISAHMKLADSGDVDLVGGGDFPPGGSTGHDDTSPYAEEGEPEPLLDEDYDEGAGPGIQESQTRTGSVSVFAEHDDGQDDEGPEETDEGIEEEEPEDEESLDEEVAEDEGDSSADDGQDEGGEPESDDGGHDEPHQPDDSDDDEGTDNPGDESDDEGIEKQSAAELQQQYGLSYLAGANYSLAEQDRLIREGEGKTARNRGDLSLTGTHYEAAKEGSSDSPEDTLAFLN